MSAGGKGHAQRPTDTEKFKSNYDQINWTKEEDEEFERIANLQNSSSGQCALAKTRESSAPTETGTKESTDQN